MKRKFKIVNSEHDEVDYTAGEKFGAEAAEQDMIEGAVRRMSKKDKGISSFELGFRKGYADCVETAENAEAA